MMREGVRERGEIDTGSAVGIVVLKIKNASTNYFLLQVQFGCFFLALPSPLARCLSLLAVSVLLTLAITSLHPTLTL